MKITLVCFKYEKLSVKLFKHPATLFSAMNVNLRQKKEEYHCIHVLMKRKYVYKKLMDDVSG